jgi:hypothetical protein
LQLMTKLSRIKIQTGDGKFIYCIWPSICSLIYTPTFNLDSLSASKNQFNILILLATRLFIKGPNSIYETTSSLLRFDVALKAYVFLHA